MMWFYVNLVIVSGYGDSFRNEWILGSRGSIVE